MVIGYRATALAGTANIQHTPQHLAFYSSRLDQWFCILDVGTGADWHLMEWDGTFPAPGALGGWSISQSDLGADVQITGVDSAQMDVFWDDSAELLYVRVGQSSSLYQVWTLRAAPDNDWQSTISEALGSLTQAEAKESSLCIAEDGIAWVAYVSSNQLKAMSRTGGTWQTPINIEASASTTSIVRVALRRYTAAGAAGLMAVYGYRNGGDKLKAARRLDSDSAAAAWTIETAVTEDIDDHVDAQTVLLGSDTTSTVCVCYKDGGTAGNLRTIRRDSAGSWSTPITIRTELTRPKSVLDEDNEEFYVFYPDHHTSSSIRELLYRSVAIDSMETLGNWSAEQVLIENQPNAFNSNLSLPAHNIGGASDLMGIGKDSVNQFFWWNLVAIDPVVDTSDTEFAGTRTPSVVQIHTLKEVIGY